jgi:hypothetical protein
MGGQQVLALGDGDGPGLPGVVRSVAEQEEQIGDGDLRFDMQFEGFAGAGCDAQQADPAVSGQAPATALRGRQLDDLGHG